jgi:hypothetical protein
MNLLAFDTGTEVMSIAVCRTVNGVCSSGNTLPLAAHGRPLS